MKAAVQAAPEAAGIEMANWNWKVVRTFVREHFGRVLCGRSCLNYLHRLDFVLKRPKKRLLKADTATREAFVAIYVALLAEAQETGAKIFFVDEAHFRADGDLRAPNGCCAASQPSSIRPVRDWVRRPPTTRASAWRPVRCRSWK